MANPPSVNDLSSPAFTERLKQMVKTAIDDAFTRQKGLIDYGVRDTVEAQHTQAQISLENKGIPIDTTLQANKLAGEALRRGLDNPATTTSKDLGQFIREQKAAGVPQQMLEAFVEKLSDMRGANAERSFKSASLDDGQGIRTNINLSRSFTTAVENTGRSPAASPPSLDNDVRTSPSAKPLGLG